MRIGEFAFRYNGVDIFFGAGVVSRKLPGVVSGYVKALIITSKTAARVSGALEDVMRALEKVGVRYIVYDKVTPNPNTELADEATLIAESEGVDIIFAVGGGSVIDVAKTVSVIANTGFSSVDLVRGQELPRTGGLGLVVVNLTHGTGSEVNRFAVLTVSGTIEKRGFRAKYPNVSFDDPLYTRTLSRNQSIYTSLDAFYHAYESATSRNSNIMITTLAHSAINLIVRNLPRVLEKPEDIEARSKLLYASMIAGIAIDLAGGSHLNHALEHGFSGLNPALPHGAGLAMLGPRVVYYTHKAVPEVSALLLKTIDPTIKPISEDAEKAMRAVEEFQRSLGFTEKLSQYGISMKDVNLALNFVERAIAERYHANIPFSVTRAMLEEIAFSAL